MGRYYKTATYNPEDTVYKLPVQDMMRAVAQTDAMVNAGIQQTDLFGNAIKINSLAPDTAQLKAIQKGYNDQINEVAKNLQSDPTAYRKQMPVIRQLGRTIQDDLQSGALAAIRGNVDKLTAWDKIYAPKVAEGKITPEAYQTMKAAFLQNYKGIGTNPNAYNQLQTEDVMETQDFNKLLKDTIKDIKANSKLVSGTSSNGKWLVSNSGKQEEVSEARVAQIAMDTLMGDQKVLGYLKQGAKYGYLKGVTDENGKFINPYTLDKNGQPVFDGRSILTAPIRGIVGQQAYRQSESKSDMSADPYGMADYKFQQDVAMLGKKSEQELKDFVFKEGVKLASDKKMADYNNAIKLGQMEKAGEIKQSIEKAATTTKTPDAVQFKDNGNMDLTFNPFGNNGLGKAKDGTKGYVPGHDVLYAEVAQAANLAKANLAKANDPKLSENERHMYLQQAVAAEDERRSKSAIIDLARHDVDAKLRGMGYNPEAIKRLNNIGNEIKNTQSELKRLGYSDTNESLDGASAAAAKERNYANPNKTRIDQLVKKLTAIKSLDKENTKQMQSWFKENQEKTKVNIAVAGTDAKQQKQIFEEFAKNPEAFKILNLKNQTQTEADDELGWWSTKKGSNAAKMPAITNNIEEMMKDFDVVGINAPTAGIPASVTLKAKVKDGFLLNNRKAGENFIVQITPEMQDKLGSQLANSKDPLKSKIGKSLTNASVARAVADVTMKLQNREGGNQPTGSTILPTVTLSNGAQFTPRLVVQSESNKANPGAGDLGVYTFKVSQPDGSFKQYKGTKGDIPQTSDIEVLMHQLFSDFQAAPEKK